MMKMWCTHTEKQKQFPIAPTASPRLYDVLNTNCRKRYDESHYVHNILTRRVKMNTVVIFAFIAIFLTGLASAFQSAAPRRTYGVQVYVYPFLLFHPRLIGSLLN